MSGRILMNIDIHSAKRLKLFYRTNANLQMSEQHQEREIYERQTYRH